jgi:hypothetical protein
MTILHDHIDNDGRDKGNQSNRTVLLRQHADQYGHVSFTCAAMTIDDAVLIDSRDSGKARKFTLTAKEADAFVEQWTMFKADVQAAKNAARAEDEAATEHAFALARAMRDRLGEVGTLEFRKLADYDEPVYTVRLPALTWTYYKSIGGDHIYTGKGLLEAVKAALVYLNDHLAWLKKKRGTWGDAQEKQDTYERWITVWHKHKDELADLADITFGEAAPEPEPQANTVNTTISFAIDGMPFTAPTNS